MIDLIASTILNSSSIAYPFDTQAIVSSGYSESRIHPILGYPRPHRAVDLVKPCGTPVKSSISGKVMVAGAYGVGYGTTVIVKNETQKTLVAHLSKTFVKAGDEVESGTVVGAVGTSGFSSGCHLHSEVHLKNSSNVWQAVDPLDYYDMQNVAKIKRT